MQNNEHDIVACIDGYCTHDKICGIPILHPSKINFTGLDEVIVIFAVSSEAIQSIFAFLSRLGLTFRKDFILYSEFFYLHFCSKAFKNLESLSIEKGSCQRYEAFVLNSVKPHHTTILGSVLLDALLDRIHQEWIPGAIMEVGAYEGGNALALLSLNKYAVTRPYYVMDSFEGFPVVTDFDPLLFGEGDYATKTPYNLISNGFAVFDNTEVIKGFVPKSFDLLPKDLVLSLVFYDCDLYQPALDTFIYAWNRLSPGGYMVVHDYFAESGGFEGVKVAVDEFFLDLPVIVTEFSENTMAVIKKPLIQ